MNNFPIRLRELRNKLGYTQSELAEKLRLSRASINSWEMGYSAPSTALVARIAKLFHVTTDYLLGLEECVTIRTDNLSERQVSVMLNTVKAFNEVRQEHANNSE